MLLSNLNIAGQDGRKQIHIEKDKIAAIAEEKPLSTEAGKLHLFFEDAIAFPGLVNSHDHLDFNLFPQLGNRIYKNYAEWGNDIHQSNKKIINQVLTIPQQLRTRWGIYKNLISGITTVVNHGKELKVEEDLISIYQETNSLHSIAGEKAWRWKLINPFGKKQPLVIHIGEGTDHFSSREIDRLIRWNIFRKEIIAVHGVAMNEKQARFFKSLIWCPDSNYYLLGKTAEIGRLKMKTKILFGTDSTLTASWNIWEQLRLARAQCMMTDTELFDSLTTTAASVWQLGNSGCLSENHQADIVIAKKKNNLEGWDAFYALNPEDILLVLNKGNIKLFDEEIYDQLKSSDFTLNDFYKIHIAGKGKYVQGNLPGLMNNIEDYYPSIQFPVTYT